MGMELEPLEYWPRLRYLTAFSISYQILDVSPKFRFLAFLKFFTSLDF